MNMKRIAYFVLLLSLFLTSCESTYYCSVSGFGTTPVNKRYYVMADDPTLDNDLEFQEYASTLKRRLNEVGYVEADPRFADLCIYLSYFVGEEKLSSTTTSTTRGSSINSNSFSTSNTDSHKTSTTTLSNDKTTLRTSTFGSSQTNTSRNSNTRVNTTIDSKTDNVYVTPIGCVITAVDCRTQKSVWKVKVDDEMRSNRTTSFRKLMPWMIACAQKYFGVSGESRVRITAKEGELLGLRFPYDNSFSALFHSQR